MVYSIPHSFFMSASAIFNSQEVYLLKLKIFSQNPPDFYGFSKLQLPFLGYI